MEDLACQPVEIHVPAGGTTMKGTKERNFRSIPNNISLERLTLLVGDPFGSRTGTYFNRLAS
jgi:hypothetical protein